MSEEEKFDCLVVGGGPAGVAAGITLARAGLHAALLERGEFPGSKNLFGGILFSTVLNEILPEFWKEAPVERHVVRRRFSFLNADTEIAFDLRSEKFGKPPYNHSFIVLRSKFDKWFAERSEKEGLEIYPGVVVDDFVWKDGRVAGIKARGEKEGEYDELYADLVICAEGANSLLAEKAGLRKDASRMNPHNRVVAVKEILRLDREVVEDRFHLAGDEGASYEYFGGAVEGMVGSGFIYTNKDSISVGIGCLMEDFMSAKRAPYDMLDAFKQNPVIARLVRGGEVVEYSTHMIVEDSYEKLPQLSTGGIILVGDSAGLCNSSIYHEVTNLAMQSGVLAAETAIEAKKKGDYSAESLSAYRQKLEASFVLKDMVHYKRAVDFLSRNKQFLNEYPDLFMELATDFFTVDKTPKKEIRNAVFKKFRSRVKLFRFAKDMWNARKAML
jgi:electron transfer flavoprotein-quinone oxidoreductase